MYWYGHFVHILNIYIYMGICIGMDTSYIFSIYIYNPIISLVQITSFALKVGR